MFVFVNNILFTRSLLRFSDKRKSTKCLNNVVAVISASRKSTSIFVATFNLEIDLHAILLQHSTVLGSKGEKFIDHLF